uniref:Mediator of RNA polymerase II transcription subunit 14 n=1 Tax=Setaria digitata TaxID=48799 RepID=A0A915PP03_9BILA
MDDEEYMKPMLPTVPEKCGPPVIPLGHLIEFAVQQIFHELTVLSELLPKKLDSDRKISIVQFAHSTRVLFIKLLAVVKWVKSSKKFESCASICYFLDQQSQYFVDTADRLVQLAREELVFARLPTFQVALAVDVLTVGTFPRLPLCIKSRFIPDPPITPREETCVLARLNQVIQYRLSSYGTKLSPRISKTVIRNGMVTMTVNGEFEVSLTLLGERPTTKWTLLNIKILVEDYEIGFGTKLIHPLQVNMLHNVLQLRMDKSLEPLEEVYNLLHTFAQMLQLDVLFCQATQVLSGDMCHYAVIERYDRDAGILILNYWLKRVHNRYTSQYKIKIFIDKEDGNSGLRVRHFPVGKGLPCIDDRSGRLSINRLLSETVGVRCRERLLRIRERLGLLKQPVIVSLTGRAAPTLTYPLLGAQSHADEMLVVSINGFSGNVIAIVRALGSCPELRELEQLIDDRVPLQAITDKMDRLRILLMLERYRKAVAPLPVRIVPENVFSTRLSSLPELPPDRICLQFIKEEMYYLIVSFMPNEQTGVNIDMYLLSNVERKLNMVRLHPSQLLTTLPESSFSSTRNDDDLEPPTKRYRWLGDRRLLTSAVATLDDRLAFMRICEELDRRNVKYKPLTVEPTVGGLILHITDFSEALPSGSDDFFSSVINCCLRLDTRTRVIWPFECTLINTPLVADFYEPIMGFDYDSGKTKTTVMEIHGSGGVSSPNTSESVSTHMIDRLIIFAHMFDPVKEFAAAYYGHYNKYCNVVAFTYHKLVLAYGSSRNMLMMLSWRTQKAPNNKQYFYLTFGIGPSRRTAAIDLINSETLWNPHVLLASRLQERFNKRRSLIDLVQYLIDTVTPLSALHSFSRIRLQSLRAFCQMMCYDAALALNLQVTISVVDEYRIRLIYGHVHLEFLLLSNSRIGLRDCSLSPAYAFRLRHFCSNFLSAELRNLNEEKSPSTLGWTATGSGPGSLPPHQMVRSPASRIVSSPMSHMSLSVPPMDSVASSLRYSSDYRSKTPILLDHDSLQCMTSVDASGNCPLDQYLFALAYLSKLGPALEGYRREHRGSGAHPVIQFRQLIATPESVRLSVVGAAPPNLKHEPFLARILYFPLQPSDVGIFCTYGDETPADSDIRIAELYFVRFVARLGNEIAVVAFANACRLAAPGAFSALTRVMSVQMNWTEDTPWRPLIQLVMWSQEGSVPRARISPGIVIDQTNISVLILLCLRPARHNPSEKNADASKHLIPLIYNTQTNTVARRSSGADDDASNATTILSNVSEQYSLTNEPALWPAIYSLAHNFAIQR